MRCFVVHTQALCGQVDDMGWQHMELPARMQANAISMGGEWALHSLWFQRLMKLPCTEYQTP